MSEKNKKPEIVNIDKNGEIVINDPELAKMTKELTQEDLNEVSGGLKAELLDDGHNLACDTNC